MGLMDLLESGIDGICTLMGNNPDHEHREVIQQRLNDDNNEIIRLLNEADKIARSGQTAAAAMAYDTAKEMQQAMIDDAEDMEMLGGYIEHHIQQTLETNIVFVPPEPIHDRMGIFIKGLLFSTPKILLYIAAGSLVGATVTTLIFILLK